MNNAETLINIQRETVNNARADGDVFRAFVMYFVENDGIGTRQECFAFVGKSIGLTVEEASIKHDTASGNSSFLETAIDFTKLDMRNGEFGEAAQALDTDNGTWMLENAADIDVPRSVCHYNVTAANTKEKREALTKRFKAELLSRYKSLDGAAQARFKTNGGTMDKCIASMFTHKTAAESINLYQQS